MTQIRHAARSAPGFIGWRFFAVLVVGALIYAAPALADPPGRIGRIAWLSGTVQLESAASGAAFSAPLNQPLTSGDILSSDAGSRVEIQIGSKIIRLDENSVLELDRIDDEQVSVYLAKGRAIVELTTPEAIADFALATANGRFTASDTGVYRFDADTRSSVATAYSGQLRFAGDGDGVDLRAGVATQFWDDGQTRFRLLAPINDEFSAWSSARQRRPSSGAYARYVSPEMTGAADLDAYGDWAPTPEYGTVWYPRNVAGDWVPYRSGNWTWVAPWGWSWVGHEPWGFAPFHYGRWVHHHGRWGWVPGERIARPVFAPALVAWIGTPGAGVALSVGSRPSVGWFPLAPREVYVPAYRSSADYVRRVNRSHVTRIDNLTLIVNNPQTVVERMRYVHRQSPHAVTIVPGEVIVKHRSVAPAAIGLGDARRLRDQAVHATAPVAAPVITQERAGRPDGRRFDRREDRRDDRRDAERQPTIMRTPASVAGSGAPALEAAGQETIGTRPRAERRESGRPRDVAPPGRIELTPPAPAAIGALPPELQRRIERTQPAPQARVESNDVRPRDATVSLPSRRIETAPLPAAATAGSVPTEHERRSERTPPPAISLTPTNAPPSAPANVLPPELQRRPPVRSSFETGQTRAPEERPRRDESVLRAVPQRESRSEATAPASLRPAAEAVAAPAAPAPAALMRESRGAASQPPEARAEARAQRQEERQRASPGDDGQRRGDGERR